MLVDIVGSGVGGYLDISQRVSIPTVLWLCFLIVGLLIAPFLAFHTIRKKRDELQAQLNIVPQNGVIVLKDPPHLIFEIHTVDFCISGESGYPLLLSEEDKAKWLRLGIVFDGNLRIETLELVISGKEPIPAFEWKPGQAAYYYYFQIPNWVKSKEERTIQVRAFANGVKWGSPEKSINFPAL